MGNGSRTFAPLPSDLAHFLEIEGVLTDKILSAQGPAFTDEQSQIIRSLEDAFGKILTTHGQFSGALTKAAQGATRTGGFEAGQAVIRKALRKFGMELV